MNFHCRTVLPLCSAFEYINEGNPQSDKAIQLGDVPQPFGMAFPNHSEKLGLAEACPNAQVDSPMKSVFPVYQPANEQKNEASMLPDRFEATSPTMPKIHGLSGNLKALSHEHPQISGESAPTIPRTAGPWQRSVGEVVSREASPRARQPEIPGVGGFEP